MKYLKEIEPDGRYVVDGAFLLKVFEDLGITDEAAKVFICEHYHVEGIFYEDVIDGC